MLIRLCLLVLALLAAGPTRAGDAMFPPGSRVGLVPPPGMIQSPAFPGFVDPARKAAILIGEFPPEAYDEVEKGLTANAQKSGFTQESREDLALAEGKGVLVVGQQDLQGIAVRRWVLVAETGGVTALVSVEVQKAAAEATTDATIRSALESLKVRAVVPNEELLALLPYNLKDLAGFRIVQAAPNGGALLTDGPKNSIELDEQPVLIITVIPGIPEQGADRSIFARQALAPVPGVKDLHIERMEPMRIGGQPGHEMVLSAKQAGTDTELTVIQWLRFGSANSVRLLAIARKDDWLKMFPRFRLVRDGLEPR
ncbi:MAG TPA: hypothetical protein VK281_12950 [Xanthobacteraceae bacterium]|nr:hypothetical protein [Xanthobacteraceae bacterium]